MILHLESGCKIGLFFWQSTRVDAQKMINRTKIKHACGKWNQTNQTPPPNHFANDQPNQDKPKYDADNFICFANIDFHHIAP